MSTPSRAAVSVQALVNTPKSKGEESFRSRNHVAPSYRGPVFAVEDVWVPCALCRTPVDPVQRVPVGAMFFHPQCLRCTVCGAASETRPFVAVNEQPVCSDCFKSGGGKHNVKMLGQSPYAVGGYHASGGHTGVSCRMLESCFTQRQLQLMDRQAALLRDDKNVLLLEPPALPPVATSSSRSSQLRITASRGSSHGRSRQGRPSPTGDSLAITEGPASLTPAGGLATPADPRTSLASRGGTRSSATTNSSATAAHYALHTEKVTPTVSTLLSPASLPQRR